MKNEALVQQYRELDRDIVLFDYRLGSQERYEETVFIPTPDKKETTLAEYEALVKAARDIEAPDPVFAIMKSHFNDYLGGMRRSVEGLFKNPAGALLNCSWGFSAYLRTDARPAAERFRLFTLKARNQEAIWEGVMPYLKDVEQQELIDFANGCSSVAADLKYIKEDVPEGFEELGPDRVAEAQDILEALAEHFLEWQSYVRRELISGEPEKAEEIPDSEKIVKLPEEKYRAILRDELGVDLDELLAWHEEEIQKTRADALSIAAAIDVPDPAPATMGEVNDLLWKYAGPCESADEMYRRAEVYLRRTRALAHEYVTLPEDESCRCVKVPSELRFSYPWGGYEGGDQKRRPIAGQMFLNNFNYKEITDGWIKMNAMHETYPGHHVQYVRAITDTIPQTLKIGAKSIPLIEGTAHRTERAFEWIFGEDPFFPLFVAYRRHHTSVRIKADLMLFYYGKPVEEVVKLYMDELGFAHDIARGQVQSQMNTPGYFVCYYYGMKKLCDWEAAYGYNKKDYTEELFSVGSMSLENFHRYLDLSPEDQKRFKTDFGSLLMEDA